MKKTTFPNGAVHIDYDYYDYIDEQHTKVYKKLMWSKRLIWIRLAAAILIGFVIVFGIIGLFCI